MSKRHDTDSVRTQAQPGAPPELDAAPGERRPLSILLAEDNAVNQKVALLLLQRLGYRADLACNGLEVLHRVSQRRYDVVLMDMQMPALDGLEATRRLRAASETQGRPAVIGVTANVTAADREACLRAGMDDFVAKPLRAAELAESLARVHGRGEGRTPSAPWAQPQPQPREPEPGGPTAVDLPTLERLRLLAGTEGPEAFATLLGDHLRHSRTLVEAMRAALDQGDTVGVARAAHALRLSSAMFGALTVAARCGELEEAAEAGAGAQLPGRLAALEDAYRASRRLLEPLR